MKLGQSPDQTPAPEFAQWLVGSIDPPHWAHQVVADHHHVLGSSPDEPATADTPRIQPHPNRPPVLPPPIPQVMAGSAVHHTRHPGFLRPLPPPPPAP